MNKEQIMHLLHEQNFRLTRERDLLLQMFSNASCMLTPSQLFDLAQTRNLKVGLTTVYRLLEVLTKIGAATPFLLDGSIYYVYCDSGHHHHFVCLACHRVMDLHECPTFANLPADYHIISHKADLYGTCPDCQTTDAGELQK